MQLERVHWRSPGSVFLHGLAYLGLTLLTALTWLPLHWIGPLGLVAFAFEAEWTGHAIERGDWQRAATWAAVLVATVIAVSASVWLRAWIMRKWNEMTGIVWIWRW